MNNIDDSMGKLLLELRKDPDIFKKLIMYAQEESPELFVFAIYKDDKKIDDI